MFPTLSANGYKNVPNQYISIEVKMAHDLLNKQQVLLCLNLSYVFQSKLCSSRNYSEILFDDDDVDFKRYIPTRTGNVLASSMPITLPVFLLMDHQVIC